MVKAKHIQEPPNAIQIELVEGCPLACSFCAMQGIRNNGANGPLRIHGSNSKPYKYMTIEIAKKIAKQISKANWNSRIEFAMHGEPTIHPNNARIVRLFRKNLPKSSIMMTSNGYGLLKNTTKNIDNLMDSGINILLLEDYKHVNILSKILNKYKGKYKVYHYPQDKKVNPHSRRKPNEHHIVVCQDVTDEAGGTHGKLLNQTGSSFPKNDFMAGKRCARPFRELSIRYDGNIAICCIDFRGIYKCGNINNESINEIWQNKYFRACRKALYHGMRTFEPCIGCDARSYRVGLLPDKYGKKSLPKPKDKTWQVIKKANSGEPYTKPIKRPWE